MKHILWFLILCSFSVSAQIQETTRLDSLAETSRRYFNAQQADSMYAIMGQAVHAQISATQLSQVFQGLHAQLGSWQSVERRSIVNHIARYKATFEKGVLDLYLSRDATGLVQDFLFKPFEEMVLDKTTAVPTNNPLRTAFDKQVDKIVQSYIKKQNTVGLSIGLIKGDSLFTYAYGETARNNGQIPDSNTLFEIGSVTKTFTATLLADAVKRGLVKLDDPVNRYLPDSIPLLQKDGIPVTLKTLSNHTSGLPRLPTNLFTKETVMANPYAHYDRQRLYSYLKTATLSRPPGTEYEYSNLAVGLLGTILETVNRKPFEEQLKEKITVPLHMSHTVITLRETDRKRFATGHDAKGNPISSWEFQSLQAAGAIRSTVNDMVSYVKAEMGKGPRKLVEAMQLTQQPTFTNSKLILGLGWHWNPGNAKPWLFHQGATGGFVSNVAFNPSRRAAVIVLANSANPTEEMTRGLMQLLTLDGK